MSIETALAASHAKYWGIIMMMIQMCADADAPTLYYSRIDGLLLPQGIAP